MGLIREEIKKARYGINFLRKKMAHLNLQILYQCNFKCEICDFWKEEYMEKPQLTVPQVEIIDKKISTLGPQLISIGGGEPMMHKDIFEICNILGRNHILVMICNGWFITKESARALWESGIYEISISVDFPTAEKHDKMRGKEGAYERAINALKLLKQTRKYRYQRINMIATVMNENINEIEDLLKICRETDVTFLVSCYSGSRGDNTNNSDSIDFSNQLLDLKKRYKEFVSVRGYLSKFTEHVNNENGITPCYAGKNLFNIDCQGDVTLCIDRLDEPAGNILTDEMEDISKNLMELYKTNTCGKCWTSCRGPIESIMYGDNKLLNIWDNYNLTKRLPLSE